MKDDFDVKSVVVQVDYAENFVTEEQDAVRSAHRSTKAISIFIAYAAWTIAFLICFAFRQCYS